jgi:hypothetical protein
MKYPLVLDLAADGVPVAVTCRVLGFSKQAFYAWCKDPVPQRDWDEAHLINAALEVHRDDPAFGYRFIADELPARGITAGENRVARVMAVRALERAPGLLLLAVHHDDRGAGADHDHLAQIAARHPGRRHATVPRPDQRPHVTADLRPGLADPGQRHAVAPGQGPPHGRVRGHRAEQLALMAQRVVSPLRRRSRPSDR